MQYRRVFLVLSPHAPVEVPFGGLEVRVGVVQGDVGLGGHEVRVTPEQRDRPTHLHTGHNEKQGS